MLAYNRSEKYESTERMIDNITSIFSFSRDEEMSYLSVFSFLHGRRNEPYVLNGDLFGNLLLYLSLHVNMITRSFDHLYCMLESMLQKCILTFIYLCSPWIQLQLECKQGRLATHRDCVKP